MSERICLHYPHDISLQFSLDRYLGAECGFLFFLLSKLSKCAPMWVDSLSILKLLSGPLPKVKTEHGTLHRVLIRILPFCFFAFREEKGKLTPNACDKWCTLRGDVKASPKRLIHNSYLGHKLLFESVENHEAALQKMHTQGWSHSTLGVLRIMDPSWAPCGYVSAHPAQMSYGREA